MENDLYEMDQIDFDRKRIATILFPPRDNTRTKAFTLASLVNDGSPSLPNNKKKKLTE